MMLYFQDGGHYVMLPSGEFTCSVRPTHMQQRPPAAS